MDWKGIFRVELGKHGSATISHLRTYPAEHSVTKRPEVQYIDRGRHLKS